MRRHTTFRNYFLARLLLCLTLLSQSSMALAAPSSLPNHAGQATLVVNHSDYDGYTRFIFSRAVAVVKRQLTVAFAAFRRCSHAAHLRRTVAMVGMR